MASIDVLDEAVALAAGPADAASDLGPAFVFAADRPRVMRVLWWTTALIIALGIVFIALVSAPVGDFPKLYLRFLNLDAESCLPAWYSSILLLIAAFLLAAHIPAWRRRDRRMGRDFAILSGIFVYLSLDEEAAIHEELGRALSSLHLSGFLRFSWVIAVAPLLLAGGLWFLPFLLRLPSPLGRKFLVAGLVYVGCAFGVEMIGGYIVGRYGVGLLYYAEVAVEEGGEMVGACLFISALLQSLASLTPAIALRVRSQA